MLLITIVQFSEHMRDLISVDPANRASILTHRDADMEKVKDCFRRIETVAVADNYHRSVLGLPPAPYPEILPTQNQLQTIAQTT